MATKVQLKSYAGEILIPGTTMEQVDLLATTLATFVVKVEGMGLSKNDLTDTLLSKLNSLENYDDSALSQSITALQGRLDTLVSGNATTAIDSFNEITNFLSHITDTTTLEGILAGINTAINTAVTNESNRAIAAENAIIASMIPQSFASPAMTNPFSQTKTPRRIGDVAINTTSGEIWTAIALAGAESSWEITTQGLFGGTLITDVHSITKNGFYSITATGANVPTTDENFYILAMCSNLSTTSAILTVIGLTSGKMYMKRKVFSVWDNYVGGITQTELSYMSGATGNIQAQLSDIDSSINGLKESIYNKSYLELSIVEQENGALKSDGTVDTASVGYYTRKYNVAELNEIAVTGRSGVGTFCLLCFYDISDNFILAQYIGLGTSYIKLNINIPANSIYVKVTGPTDNMPGCFSIIEEKQFYKKEETPDIVIDLTKDKAKKSDIFKAITTDNQFQINSIENDSALHPDGTIQSVTGYFVRKFLIDSKTEIAVTGHSGGSTFCLAVAFDIDNTVLQSFEIGKSTDYIKEIIQLPISTSYIKICGTSLSMPNAFFVQYINKFYTKEETDAEFLTEQDLLDKADKTDVYITIPQLIYGLTVIQGKYPQSTSGAVTDNTQWAYIEYNILPDDILFATGFIRPRLTALAVYKDAGGNFISNQFVGSGVNANFDKQQLTIPNNATKVVITGASNTEQSGYNRPLLYRGIKSKAFYTKEETLNTQEIEGKVNNSNPNYWLNKTIWWCGTSIPAGSDDTLGSEETVAGNYPTQVGVNLGATVINKAVGGSMCRANVRTGDYNGANISNITSALSMTNEEVESFISNYSTIRQLSGNSSWPTSLASADLARLRAASFENLLLPYLDGTYQMPSLFVIDHGHNDFKYTLANGNSDIGLEPTITNISGEILAEDTFMTSNSSAKLEKFMGSLVNIPSAKKSDFIASLNRNCFIGSINFIVTLILRYNPHARIIFVSNYEYENGVYPNYLPLISAQESLANSWAFPLCKIYEYLGFSNKIIPNSMAWFNSKYPSVTPATTDITVFNSYCPDGVHPHSDITGDANTIYAGILSEYIKNIR